MEGTEQAVRWAMCGSYFVIGLSHLVQPQAWTRFFVGLRERGDAGVITIGLMALATGIVTLALHWVWRGVAMLLTVVACLQVLKGIVYLLAPATGLRAMGDVTLEHRFRVAGALMTVLAIVVIGGDL